MRPFSSANPPVYLGPDLGPGEPERYCHLCATKLYSDWLNELTAWQLRLGPSAPKPEPLPFTSAVGLDEIQDHEILHCDRCGTDLSGPWNHFAELASAIDLIRRILDLATVARRRTGPWASTTIIAIKEMTERWLYKHQP